MLCYGSHRCCLSGSPGLPGIEGIPGIPGEEGPQGNQGIQGPPGIPGEDIILEDQFTQVRNNVVSPVTVVSGTTRAVLTFSLITGDNIYDNGINTFPPAAMLLDQGYYRFDVKIQYSITGGPIGGSIAVRIGTGNIIPHPIDLNSGFSSRPVGSNINTMEGSFVWYQPNPITEFVRLFLIIDLTVATLTVLEGTIIIITKVG